MAAGIGLTAGRQAFAQDYSGTLRIGYEGTNTTVEPFIEATAAALEEANPDLRIELEPSPGGNYTTQLVLQINGGRAPDVFLLLGVATAELAEAGFIAPLDEFTANWDGWQEYAEPLRLASGYKGQTWTIPFLMDTHFLYYRKDIFEAAGLPTEWQPADTAEILAFASVIKSVVPDVIPYALYAGANGGNGTVSRGFVPLLYANGGTLQDEDGLWIIDSCQIRAVLAYYAEAYQTLAVVPQDVMTSSSPSSAMRAAMGAGELGILYEGCWAYGPWLEDDPEQTTAQIGLAQFPVNADDSTFAVGGTGNSWFLNAASQQQKAGWAFIQAFNSRENQVAINLVDPHIPARNDAAADPAFQETAFLSAMVGTASSVLLAEPDPSFRSLIGIIQNATGLVATGEATADEAAARYAEELTRVLGSENVVSLPCP